MLPAFWHLELASKKLGEFQKLRREEMEEADHSITAACDAAHCQGSKDPNSLKNSQWETSQKCPSASVVN